MRSNDIERAIDTTLSGLTTTDARKEQLLRATLAETHPCAPQKPEKQPSRVKLKWHFSLSFGLSHMIVAAVVIIIVIVAPMFIQGQDAIFRSWQSDDDEHYVIQGFDGEKNPQVAEAAYQPTEMGNFSAQTLEEAQKFYGPELPLPSWLPERFSVITYEIFVSEELRSCTILHVSDDGTLIYQVTDYFDPTSAYSYIEQDGEGEYITLSDGRTIYVTTNVQYYTATWSTDREHIVLSGAITREEAIRMAESVRIP